MNQFDFGISWFPRTRAGRALLVTLLYAGFALLTLYAPINGNAPFVKLFGTPDEAREALVSFSYLLFWPLCGTLAVALLYSLYRLWTLPRRAD
ncbi:MAG TPA: hypothetical protein VFB54_06710 [Burkholderiales bacterium]|nr:hypothetical protein [Burkholderiales bacterium]